MPSTFLLWVPLAIIALGCAGPWVTRCWQRQGNVPCMRRHILWLCNTWPRHREGTKSELGQLRATQLPAPNASAPLSCFLGLSNCKIKQKKRVNLQSGWQGP